MLFLFKWLLIHNMEKIGHIVFDGFNILALQEFIKPVSLLFSFKSKKRFILMGVVLLIGVGLSYEWDFFLSFSFQLFWCPLSECVVDNLQISLNCFSFRQKWAV